MKEYLAPEFEEVKYDVEDCLGTSGDENKQGDGSNWNDDNGLFGN